MPAAVFNQENGSGSPAETMGLFVLLGFGGIGLMSLCSFMFLGGGGLWLFARSGSISRYQAAEQVPAAKDVARDVAPVANEVVEGLARAAKKGMTDDER
jgi:hypothetical protein